MINFRIKTTHLKNLGLVNCPNNIWPKKVAIKIGNDVFIKDGMNDKVDIDTGIGLRQARKAPSF